MLLNAWHERGQEGHREAWYCDRISAHRVSHKWCLEGVSTFTSGHEKRLLCEKVALVQVGGSDDAKDGLSN